MELLDQKALISEFAEIKVLLLNFLPPSGHVAASTAAPEPPREHPTAGMMLMTSPPRLAPMAGMDRTPYTPAPSLQGRIPRHLRTRRVCMGCMFGP